MNMIMNIVIHIYIYIYIYIHIYINIYMYVYIHIYTYTYMQLWKQCALPVITTMAFWQLMHLGTWWPLIFTYMYIYFIYIYIYIIYICSICLSIYLDLKGLQEFDSSYVKYTCIYIYIYICMYVLHMNCQILEVLSLGIPSWNFYM